MPAIDEAQIAAIRARMSDRSPMVRHAAASALARLVASHPALIEEVVELLYSPVALVQRTAIDAAGQIGPAAEAAVPILCKLLQELDQPTRREILRALGRIHARPEVGLSALEATLDDRTPEMVRAALAALAEYGSAAQGITPRIVSSLSHKDAGVRVAAREALWKIDPDGAKLRFGDRFDAVEAAQNDMATLKVGRGDWPQWGGSRLRNNTPPGKDIPATWDVMLRQNIKWVMPIGSQTYGNPCVANGKVFMGSNNGHAYLTRYPSSLDLGVMLCFDEATGKFLWQYSSEKLKTGRVHDWPLQGMPSTPVVDGDRMWFCTNRCEVVCADTEGFQDGENDGPFRDEANENRDEADVVWKLDMLHSLGVSPHNMTTCCMAIAGDKIFVCTANGVDESHIKLPAPTAPSFLALDRSSGKVLWSDHSPGENILHGQWASPTYAVLGGRPQVMFPGGDGWLYSFDPEGDGQGKAKLLWKFDCNPKDSKYVLGGRGTRNELIAFACVYDDLVYIAIGQDPEHGEGTASLWCIDPAKHLDGSDVSLELVMNLQDRIVPHRRLQAVDPTQGERVVANPKSAVVWCYAKKDRDSNGKIDFEETFHRSISTPVIKDDLLYIADFSGMFHCLNAKSGQVHWTYDMLAACWSSALVVDGKVYIGEEDGDIAIFRHSADPDVAMPGGIPLTEINMGTSTYSTPIVANNVLYIASKTHLYAIAQDEVPLRPAVETEQ